MSSTVGVNETTTGKGEGSVDLKKRRFLIAATSALGAAGAAALAVPFITSMSPSERAKAAGAPVEVNVSKIEPGALLRVEWRGKPVWVVHRTKEMLDALESLEPLLRDPKSDNKDQQPDYARNRYRSIKPEYSILVGICTHLGCSPTYRPEVAPADLGPEWKGGYYCPCHGSRYDMAGRVYKNVPAPTNLKVPPHMYLSETVVLIGRDEEAV